MATETEELRITVTLADNASAGLAKVNEELKHLGSGAGQQQVEKFKRETSEITTKVKAMSGEVGEAFKGLGLLRGGLAAGGAGLALFGYEMTKQIAALGQYADRLRNVAQLGKTIGVDPGVIKNISDQLKIFGVSGEQAQASIAKFAESMAALQREPSMRAGILRDTAREGVGAMNALIDRLNATKDVEDKLNIVREGAENVRRNALKRGASEERAADEARKFGQKFGYDAELSYAGALKKRTDDEKKADEARTENAKKYSTELANVYSKWEDIKNLMNDSQMGENSTFFLALKAANATLQGIVDAIKWLHAAPPPLTPEQQQKKDEFDKGRLQDENRRRELLGLPPLTSQELKKSTDENTAALKKLTSLIDGGVNTGGLGMSGPGGGIIPAAYHPGGGGPFGPGGGGGGGFGGGGYANLGQSTSGYGGGAPYGSSVGAGTGAGAGATPAAGGGAPPAGGGGQQTYAGGSAKQRTAQAVANEMRSQGVPEHVIAGMLANTASESGGDPTLRHADQPKFSGEAHYAHGLFQEGGAEWNTWAADMKARGLDPMTAWKDPKEQARFVAGRLKGTIGNQQYAGLYKRMTAPGVTKEQAAQMFVSGYLRPAERYRQQRVAEYGRGVPGVEHYTGPGTAAAPAAGGAAGGSASAEANVDGTGTGTYGGNVKELQSKIAGIRKGALASPVRDALDYASSHTGLTVEVGSGGQPESGPHRTGSHRHDLGMAADFKLRDDKGNLVSINDPRAIAFYRHAARAGMAGGGAARGYMGEYTTHLDPGHRGGVYAGSREFREAMAAGQREFREKGMPARPTLAADRGQIDKSQATETKVTGDGKISVDVNAPKGTHVSAEADGLFKKVEINRQTQMSEAPRGPKGGYATQDLLN